MSEKTDLERMTEALRHAREEFKEYIEDEYGLDPAFFDLKLVGYLLNRDFKPVEKITIHPEFKVQESEKEKLRKQVKKDKELGRPEGVSEEEWEAYLEAKKEGMLGVDPLKKKIDEINN